MKALLEHLVPRRIAQGIRIARYEAALPAKPWPRGRPHGLPGELIVSLTSYPRRFDTLHLCIRSLLMQAVSPDRIVLWIARADAAALPRKVRELESQGLVVRLVDDTRSYKKLVDAVTMFPRSFVATADDDMYYAPDWLETLVAGVLPGRNDIICHRAHRIPPATHRLAPYLSWQWDVQDDASRRPSVDLLATGVGGILYPPGTLHADVTDRETFLRVCPLGDDLWFYWMARRAGSRYRKVGGPFIQATLPSSRGKTLFERNVGGMYDRQIANLIELYGLPNDAAFPVVT